ncbi:MAG: ABC transporter ATP-binding protein/permease [Saccharofermentanales bacterium]
MSKLTLTDIRKTYKAGSTTVEALKGVSLAFRESEFVAILGPSGCGKTTLLNIIGGLDRYDSGDLIIQGLSTKYFRDKDWDSYRNRSIGFVFQNYNLITHQSVLQNVEIALTLSGVPAAERKRRAIEALASVHLEDQIHKKPNQLSGGQMQRVAIARALVNNPDIILADEPTGALDTHTGTQIMDILKNISKTKLVIMVTHNPVITEYSNRIIRLLDGELQLDSNPLLPDETDEEQTDLSQKIAAGTGIDEESAQESAAAEKAKSVRKMKKLRNTSMSLSTATSLSFKNLLTKKGRTIITSFAGSIGIIGVALVLALSSGLSGYIANMQSEALAGFPVSISTGEQRVDFNERRAMINGDGSTDLVKFQDSEAIYRYDKEANATTHTNAITQEYLDYIAALESELPEAVNTISYSRGVGINLLARGESSVVKFETSQSGGGPLAQLSGNAYWQEMPDNSDFILSLYDLMGEGSRLPESKNEVVLVVDEYNRLDEALFQKLGIYGDSTEYTMNDFIGRTMLKVVPNDVFYTRNEAGIFVPAATSDYDALYEGEQEISLTITGILRLKEGAASSYLSPGIVYTTALTDYIVENAVQSEIAVAQAASADDVILGIPFANDKSKEQQMISLGALTIPTGIDIYPKDFAGKDQVKAYLDAYNADRTSDAQVIYTDLAESITSMIGTLLSTITYVLIGFAAISLLVSTIMIGIITYVSVIERTKEIGILRSVGARKKDVSRVFNAETLIIGFVAGMLGIGISYLLTIPINSIISRLVEIDGIADMTIYHAVLLVAGSMLLTFIAGLVPARMAAQKDPVVALRID